MQQIFHPVRHLITPDAPPRFQLSLVGKDMFPFLFPMKEKKPATFPGQRHPAAPGIKIKMPRLKNFPVQQREHQIVAKSGTKHFHQIQHKRRRPPGGSVKKADCRIKIIQTDQNFQFPRQHSITIGKQRIHGIFGRSPVSAGKITPTRYDSSKRPEIKRGNPPLYAAQNIPICRSFKTFHQRRNFSAFRTHIFSGSGSFLQYPLLIVNFRFKQCNNGGNVFVLQRQILTLFPFDIVRSGRIKSPQIPPPARTKHHRELPLQQALQQTDGNPSNNRNDHPVKQPHRHG
ncbi:MAG: hypothetical protein MJ016_01215 [Victivallaceae bacterium]|nr:hypothetical protein [Victivallaceae bacterium]